MATEEFYEVERIVDKRKSKKGKVEYLVRWRGYGSEGDTWEPEGHLSTCMIYVHDFNRQYAERQRDGTLLRSTRSSPSNHCSPAHRPPCRSPPTAAARSDISRGLTGGCDQVKPALGPTHLLPAGLTPRTGRFTGGLMSAPPAGSARRSVDLSKTGIKILVPKSPMNSRLDSEDSPSEAAHSLEAGAQEAHLVPPEVALLEKPAGLQLGPGEERARMGTRPRSQNPLPPPLVPVTPAAMRSLSGTEKCDGDLKSWINRERFPNYLKIDSYTLYAMGDSGKLVALALVEQKSLSDDSLRHKSLVEKVSADYRDIYSRNFYFGFMEGSDYINGLVMGEAIVPSFIVVNLSNDGYFLPLGTVETEHHLLDFLNGVLDGSIQCHGGNGVDQRVRRFIYDITVTLTPVFRQAPLFGCFLVGFPLAIVGIFFYLCCKNRPSKSDDDGDDGVAKLADKKSD